ncbi:MAG: tetratricopeptide repeat protein [Phycisphaerae bacterium]
MTAALLGVLAAAPALAQAPTAPASQSSPGNLTPIAVLGFTCGADVDSRDQWLPTAIEESLIWRLRRAPGVVVIPGLRAAQAWREIREKDDDPPDWERVSRLLGARNRVLGEIGGAPAALTLTIRLESLDSAAGEPSPPTQFGPGPFFDVLDIATRWLFKRLGVAALLPEREALIFARPAQTLSAVEFYAKGVSAMRSENGRDALHYADRAVEYDPRYRPALLLLAQLSSRGDRSQRVAAAVRLRALGEWARAAADAWDQADGEAAQGVLLWPASVDEAAIVRFQNALAIYYENDDIFGQLGAMNALCDVHLLRNPDDSDLPSAAREEFERQNLSNAAAWAEISLDLLARVGDVVSEAPTANKLALILERLGRPQAALQVHQRTLAAAQRSKSRRGEATAWMFLGQCQRKLKNWPEALAATQRCLAIADEDSKPAVRIALGDVQEAMGAPADALGQYELAFEQLKAGDDLASQLICLRQMANLRKQLGRLDDAIRTLQEALDVAHALQSPTRAAIEKQLGAWKAGK